MLESGSCWGEKVQESAALAAKAAKRLSKRTRPSVLITGTPGTGKSALCQLLVARGGFEHINVSQLIKDHELYSSYDPEFGCYEVDDDKLCDFMEEKFADAGSQANILLVEFHSPSVFPEEWFDLVVVLRADNTVLYDRLEARSYAANKIQENVTAEIMQVVLDEAEESYPKEIVHERSSNVTEEMTENADFVIDFARTFSTL